MIEELKNLIPQMIEEWEEMQDAYYPDRQQLYGFMVSVIPKLTGVEKVLDLCTGAGSLAKKIANCLPGVKITGFDFDDIMLEMAAYNTKDFSQNCVFEKRNLWQKEWCEDLPGNYDAVVSAYALHLMPDKRRLELYTDAYNLLKDGGIFICLDEVRSSFNNFDNICSTALEKFRDKAQARELAKDWRDFWNRVGRRIGRENYADDLLKTTYPQGMNTMGTLYAQLKLLREAGFSEVECFYRDLSIVIYGGMKHN